MANKQTLSNFDRQLRYYAFRCILTDLLENQLIDLREYYQLLEMLSYRYLNDAAKESEPQPEGGHM